MLFYLSLWIAKIYYRFTKNKIGDRMGVIACRLDRQFLKHIAKPETIICVTGTNGKTTTCNFLKDILTLKGYKVASNSEGANLRPGIAKALINQTTIFNHPKANIAVIEFDELSTKELFADLDPDYVLVTNLSSDTMKRNGHTDYVFDRINQGLNHHTTLVLNRDDLISSMLGAEDPTIKRYFYGIDSLADEVNQDNSLTKDIRTCPYCDSELVFDFVRYHHIGLAHCPNCQFKNMPSDFQISAIDKQNRQLTLNNKTYPLIDTNITNIYNELSAISLLEVMGINGLEKILSQIEITKSRYEAEYAKDIAIITQMVKGQNPIAVSRALAYVKAMPGQKAVIMILDDMLDKNHYHTTRGEAISWIYETDFEYLNDDSIKEIVVGGNSYADLKVRLQYAQIDPAKLSFCAEEDDTYRYLKLTDVDKIVIVRDIYMGKVAKAIIAKIKEMIK